MYSKKGGDIKEIARQRGIKFATPYDIVEESDWNYSFKTKHGIVYHAYFIDFFNIPSDI